MKQEISYYIYSPCGNDTALVQGIHYSNEIKKTINDKIMELNSNVEQVGFVEKSQGCQLIMAGGEFCGNATRSAAYFFLEGDMGQLKIKVSGVDDFIDAGIDKETKAWCRFPIYVGNDVVTLLEPGIHKVKMNGIIHIVIDENVAQEYIKNIDNIKPNAMNLIRKFNIYEADAVGVMFLEKMEQRIKIHPVVWVKSIDTLFYETACGSGSVAIGILKSLSENSSQALEVLQPSGQVIETTISLKDMQLVDAIISGMINTDGVKRKIEIDL